VRGGRWLEATWQDLRYGARMLFKTPGFTAVAALSLSLGIGANTAIFSLVDKVLIRKLPVEEPDRLVVVSASRGQGVSATFGYPDFADYSARNEVFEGLVCYTQRALTLSEGGQTERIQGMIVSGNYFTALRVQPALGRGFLPEEDKTRGTHPVVVLSYGLWQRRFGAGFESHPSRPGLRPERRINAAWQPGAPLEPAKSVGGGASGVVADCTRRRGFVRAELAEFAGH